VTDHKKGNCERGQEGGRLQKAKKKKFPGTKKEKKMKKEQHVKT